MFSKIGEFLKPLAVQNDGAEKKGNIVPLPQRKDDGSKKTTFSDDDIALISTEAIRRMLQDATQAPPAQAREKQLSVLARLEQHGIKSIPLRDGQSVWSALDDAGGFL